MLNKHLVLSLKKRKKVFLSATITFHATNKFIGHRRLEFLITLSGGGYLSVSTEKGEEPAQ